MIERATPARAGAAGCARLLTVPFPYSAMLAICSDLDETPDEGVYFETMRFLNTQEPTAMGPGVGLEVGNSIYFDMDPGQFSYWNTDDEGRERLRALMRSGHLDCLHSFGDLATTREHAARALEELQRHGCRLEVWVDHATAPTNFGSDIMRGQGDLPGAPAYHADLSLAAGIRFVWRGRVTSVVGQDVPRSHGGIFSPGCPGSWKTLLKEAAKGGLGALGSAKYAMHRPNRVLRKVLLRDGQPVREFLRFDPFSGGVGRLATADGVATVLSDRILSQTIARGGVGLLYTHLGKVRDPTRPFGEETRRAFGALGRLAGDKKILVATTARTLRFCQVRDEVRHESRDDGGGTTIAISPHLAGGERIGPADVEGLSFEVPDPGRARIFLGGQEMAPVERSVRPRDGSGVVSLPWRRLAYPL